MACVLRGKPAMYGLGIRLAFYLLWFGTVLAGWLAPRAGGSLRMTLLVLVAATFLALVVQVSNGALRAVEIYVMLLLIYGTAPTTPTSRHPALPLAAGHRLQPLLGPRPVVAPPARRVWSVLNFLLLLAVTCFQLWFWITGVTAATPDAVSAACPEYAFFFAPVLLRNQLFIAFNIVLSILLLLFTVAHMCLVIGFIGSPRWLRKKNRRARKKGIRQAAPPPSTPCFCFY